MTIHLNVTKIGPHLLFATKTIIVPFIALLSEICEPHHVVKKDDIIIVVSQKIEYTALIVFGWGCLSYASIHYKTGLNLIY